MTTIHTNSVRAFSLHPIDGDQANAAAPLTLEQSMTRQHICPCCSYPLLRHIQSGEVSWKCDHCYTSVGIYVRSQPTSQPQPTSQSMVPPRKQAKQRPVGISSQALEPFVPPYHESTATCYEHNGSSLETHWDSRFGPC